MGDMNYALSVSMHRYIAAIYIQHYSLPQLLPSNSGPTKVPPTSKESSTILLHSHFIALKKDEEMSNQYKCTYDILYTILCNPGITFVCILWILLNSLRILCTNNSLIIFPLSSWMCAIH